ncbi:hypothetical protein MTR_8g012480 [Medicago truncatula]|uniref:Uncharacterized protein n=1 Tax=Medicago truncatula TaxID=3880 RepID=G7LF75_MEDTR|nr:hypothetical protein MTR_8g012480 [Medicago truncatula]
MNSLPKRDAAMFKRQLSHLETYLADISIPANDDAIASIRLILNKLVNNKIKKLLDLGWKMCRVFDPTTFDTPSVSASMCNGFNQFTDTAESDMNSLERSNQRWYPPNTHWQVKSSAFMSCMQLFAHIVV